MLAVVTVILTVGFAGLTLGQARNDGMFVTKLTGKSMEPMLHEGDLLLADTQAEPSEGDVIVFWTGDGSESHLVCHRIVTYSLAESTGWVTKGDNNESADSFLVRDRDVVGVMAQTVPGAGWLASVTPPVSVLLITIACVCFLLLGASCGIWMGRVKVTIVPRTPKDGGRR